MKSREVLVVGGEIVESYKLVLREFQNLDKMETVGLLYRNVFWLLFINLCILKPSYNHFLVPLVFVLNFWIFWDKDSFMSSLPFRICFILFYALFH